MADTVEAKIPAGVRVSYRQEYRRCGKEGCAICAPGSPGHGPYWYATWREGGRRRSAYLGRHAPPGVAAEAEQQVPAQHDPPTHPGAAPGASATDPSVPSSAAGAPSRTVPRGAAHERSAAPASGAPAQRAGAQAEGRSPEGVLQTGVAAPLRVRTLGAFTVWRGEESIPAEAWGGRRAGTLLKCLLGAPGLRLQREQISELLWPEAEPETAAGNLRTTISLLRRALDGPGVSTHLSHLRAEGEMLILVPAPGGLEYEAWLDAVALEQRASAALTSDDPAPCRAALALYAGDYLPEDRYEPWAEGPRERLRRLHEALLLHLARLAGAVGELEEAETCLRRVLAADPCQEEAAAQLMGLLAAAGRRAEALRCYQRLATALEDELGLAPGGEVEALRARLLAQARAPVAARRAPATPPPAERPTNLPAALTSFVGRAWELEELAGLLRETRLVTLTGIGGCGKTRLALEAASRALAEFPDGVWLVELAALTDPALVPQVVAGALGVDTRGAAPERPMLSLLTDFLRPRRLLLVLDNCEHLLDASAALVAALLRGAPALRVLATSRAALQVPGEASYRVPSLAVSDPERLPGPEQMVAYEAVRLFTERARAHMPGRGDGLDLARHEVARAVARICARLDGLPLAIELAAARLSSMNVVQVAARLDDRFRLLTGGPRTALPRQQTLRAALDWSHSLLSVQEQALLRRLAAFAGGCTLAAAEAVCVGVPVEDAAVVDLLSRLVEHSLVQTEEREGETRYLLLETVREYAREKLAAAGEEPVVRGRHLGWCVALAEEAELRLVGPEQVAWLPRLEVEHDNFRAALGWSLVEEADNARAIRGLQLACALNHFWFPRGHYAEGRAWLERLLRLSAEVPQALRADACNLAGRLAWAQGDFGAARALYEHGLVLARQAGDSEHVGVALHGLGTIALDQGQLEHAQALLEECLALRRALQDRRGMAATLHNLANIAARRGEYARSEEICGDVLSIAREIGYVEMILNGLSGLMHLAHIQGDPARARRHQEEGLALARAAGHSRGVSGALYNLGVLAVERGESAPALALLRECLTVALQSGDKRRMAMTLREMARLAVRMARPRQAAWLLGAAEAVRQGIGAEWTPVMQRLDEETRERARGALDEARYMAAWTAGQAATLEEAVAAALEDEALEDR